MDEPELAFSSTETSRITDPETWQPLILVSCLHLSAEQAVQLARVALVDTVRIATLNLASRSSCVLDIYRCIASYSLRTFFDPQMRARQDPHEACVTATTCAALYG